MGVIQIEAVQPGAETHQGNHEVPEKLSIGELPGQRKPLRRGVLGCGEPLTHKSSLMNHRASKGIAVKSRHVLHEPGST